MKKFSLFLAFISCCLNSYSQPVKRTTIPEYINKYKNDAIKDMMKMGVPASITLAQGILESESGNSLLAKKANNHFGIKCHNDWTGETFHQDDDARDECFRKYNTVLDSYDDHGRFLRERPRYAFLFDYEISDYKSWAHGLKKAGYATNPRYAELLIKLINEYKLYEFDKGGKKLPIIIPNAPLANAQPKKQSAATKQHNAHKKPAKKAQSVHSSNAQSVPYLIAKKEDTWLTIAIANDMRLWQILKYNDAEKDDNLVEGDVVYLKPKRGKPSQEFHIVADNESLWQISQKYGVKLKKLIKLNNLTERINVEPGQKIILR